MRNQRKYFSKKICEFCLHVSLRFQLKAAAAPALYQTLADFLGKIRYGQSITAGSRFEARVNKHAVTSHSAQQRLRYRKNQIEVRLLCWWTETIELSLTNSRRKNWKYWHVLGRKRICSRSFILRMQSYKDSGFLNSIFFEAITVAQRVLKNIL